MLSAISFVISTQYGRNYHSRVLYWTILIVATLEGYNHNDDNQMIIIIIITIIIIIIIILIHLSLSGFGHA